MYEHLKSRLSKATLAEMMAIGIVDYMGTMQHPLPRELDDGYPTPTLLGVQCRTLNEAPKYGSAFSRAVVVEVHAVEEILEISGTASVGNKGETMHPGDFTAQLWRTFRNILGLLMDRRMTWHHVIRTRCYLRDIDRDYVEFNEHRTMFYNWLGLNPHPASVGIEARLCRPDLLVEIEATALVMSDA